MYFVAGGRTDRRIVYKRRLRIYSAGNPRIYFIIISRFAAVCALSFSTVLLAPAYIAAGTPLYVVGGGKIPMALTRGLR